MTGYVMDALFFGSVFMTVLSYAWLREYLRYLFGRKLQREAFKEADKRIKSLLKRIQE